MSEPTDRIAAVLAGGRVLGALGEEARRRLAAGGGPVELEGGALLFQTGDPGDAAYVVLSGELEVRRQGADGRQVRIGALGRDALVGEMAVIDGAERSADVWAARRSKLWRMPRTSLIEALEADPRAALALVAELSRRLRAANAALESSRLLDLGARLAQLLKAEQGGRGVVTLTQTEIARRLGYSREKVNRKLALWSRSGWVEVGRDGIRLVEPDRLG